MTHADCECHYLNREETRMTYTVHLRFDVDDYHAEPEPREQATRAMLDDYIETLRDRWEQPGTTVTVREERDDIFIRVSN